MTSEENNTYNDFKAIVTVVGMDKPGIVAAISTVLANYKINIRDISQSFTQEFFTMLLIVDFSLSRASLKKVATELDEVGKEIGLSIQVLHEDVFKTMHRI